MQAGESLSFITLPDELSVPEVQSDEEKEMVFDRFTTLVKSLMARYPEEFESLETLEESGIVTVVEGSFQMLFSDGSYLHLVAYAHKDDEGLLDLGLSIAEHNEEGVYSQGYLYELSGSEVFYTAHPSSDEQDEDDTAAEQHFSVIGLYRHSLELYANQFSADETVRSEARAEWEYMNESAQLGQMERDLGFSRRNADLEDIEKIETLVMMASPFRPPLV
jgi:hypothetical protein